MATQTFTEENRARLVALHGEGKSCREIATALGFSPATISKHAKALQLDFDRSQTDLATRARVIDLAEQRTLLAQKMLVVGHELLDTVDKPFIVFNFGGKSNTYREHLLPRPTPDAQRSMVTTAAIAFDKATRILEKSNGGLETAEGVLDKLAEGFKAAAEQYRTPEMPVEPV
ncbi:helix-turn-helix domain-containing protein [Herbiconiux sp. YIM B11900]|uniref:helix-turn-helix domain-containing protein n=1 Tax=Herbiconiux sp. YIM B11900 TaxID=3404131 RepID=UPI003F85B1B1